MGKIIEVKNLFKLYRVGDSVVHALNGVNFSINEGEFCAIVGTSGSGKSTLLNMLAGLEKPTKGEVIINGEHMEKLKEDQLVSFRRDHVGSIFQSFQEHWLLIRRLYLRMSRQEIWIRIHPKR